MMVDSWWQRWGVLTRYLTSARIARGARLWNDRDAVGSEETLCTTVLITSARVRGRAELPRPRACRAGPALAVAASLVESN